MFSANVNSHYKTLKGWTKSAEYNRASLLEQVKVEAGGVYKVRMGHSEAWEIMDRPPPKGAVEWLYLNADDIPVYYWNKDQDGVTII